MKKLFAKPEANIYKLTCADVVYTSLGANEIDTSSAEETGDGGLDLTS